MFVFFLLFFSFNGTKANGDLLRTVKVCGGLNHLFLFLSFFVFVLSCAIKGDFIPFFNCTCILNMLFVPLVEMTHLSNPFMLSLKV